MKRVVSISLGSSRRNKVHEIEWLGERIQVERLGTDGDLNRFSAMFRELDGVADAIGIGGADRYVVIDQKRYAFRQIDAIARQCTRTPVVDGSGLKHTLERQAVRTLQSSGQVDFRSQTTLLVSAVDRFGMAQALVEAGGPVIYGDLLFGLGLPIPIRDYRWVRFFGSLALPIVTLLPFQWFYPTGEKQEKRTPKFEKVFREATVLCGDWHYIRRYAPDNLSGKTILTQTLRSADLDWLRTTGAQRAITTTPVLGGETFATNVMEAVLICLLRKRPEDASESDYLSLLGQLNWEPNSISLAPDSANAGMRPT